MNGGEGPSPVMRSAFLGLCPQCGAQTIFGTHIVRFEPRCRGCGLDYSQFNVGDGPAAFLILIVGAIITALALVVEVSFHPPFWAHMLLWIPLTTVAVVGTLRAAKAALLILEYRHKAREGRSQSPQAKQARDL